MCWLFVVPLALVVGWFVGCWAMDFKRRIYRSN